MSPVAFKSAQMNGEGVVDVSPEEVLEKSSQVNLIDVRRPEEYTGELGHIAGAKLVTLETEFMQHLTNLDPNADYVFICRSGMRSTKAAAMARTKGIARAYNMTGGMIAWNKLGLPTER